MKMTKKILDKIDAIIIAIALMIARRRKTVIVAIPTDLTPAQRLALARLITRSLQLSRQRSQKTPKVSLVTDGMDSQERQAYQDFQARLAEMDRMEGTAGTQRHLRLVPTE
jgi:hypothetical protein